MSADASARGAAAVDRTVFSATRIAEILAVPPAQPLLPTPEQRAVIEHPLGGSTLVIAGAGSGKTETMAGRVVWLIANGLAAPEQVLGLTFTRKAAGELSERVAGRLAAFAERLRDAAERGALDEREAERGAELRALLADGLDTPEVSTYNSFAAGIVQEFGAAAGLVPDATVIDEAVAWRIARETVLASDDPELVESALPLPRLVQHILDLDHAVSDHLTSLDRVDQVVAEFSRAIELPYNEKERSGEPSGKVYAPVRDAVAALAETPLITRLARAYAEEKMRRGLIEFSDQLALATRALEAAPDAVGVLRSRHRVVLLDEVQDTSVGQTRLLSRLFAGSPVMAVGDPNQSIYGWRGASAEGLRSFHRDFRARGASGSAATLTLSTSWRNPARVLDAANAIAAPLGRAGAAHGLDMPVLSPRPGAGSGSVEWTYPETVHEERRAVAQWMRAARQEHIEAHGEAPSAAIIFRKRSHMAAFSQALAEAGVPNRIVGLGGLLSTPEITDVVCALRCIWYADANSELIRLLTGPRFRIGVADVVGLARAARWFGERDVAQQRLSDDDRHPDSVLPDPDREFTLLDALDQLAELRDVEHRALAGISAVGRARLQEAGRMLAQLRQGVGGNIGELLRAVVQALRIDIELDANEAREHAGTAAAHANLDVFAELVEGYLAIDTRGTLASLLEWIERATEADETAEHVAAPTPGTVQLITAHGSKGLEWDLVAVPRLVAGEFPGAPRSGAGWLRTGQLPDELRGDASARPELNWRIAGTQQELRDRIADYASALKERHAEEERRLAYVAVTRAADRLLLSGSFWGGQTQARQPSPYLRELAEQGLLTGLPEASRHAEDPSDAEESTVQWPRDPLGTRRERVERAAEALRTAIDRSAGSESGEDEARRREAERREAGQREAGQREAGQRGIRQGETEDRDAVRLGAEPGETGIGEVDPAVRLLLEERRERIVTETRASGATAPVGGDPLPERITASTFHEFIEDPRTAERRRLRPIPQRPYRRTRIGNRFHEWVERRATTARGTALPLAGLDPELPDREYGEFEGEAELQPLIERFERSRWAPLRPIAVEQEVTLPFAGRTLVCKLDAVYRTATEQGEERYEIVDWKAGRPPANDAERASRFFQLDLYRHAYAQWAGIEPERIDVSLFYVAEGVELRGDRLRGIEELEAAWRSAAARLSEPSARAAHPRARNAQEPVDDVPEPFGASGTSSSGSIG